MNDLERLAQAPLRYRDLIHEYCALVTRHCLLDSEFNRLLEILKLAEEDTLLSFLLNEIDHFLASELNLIDEAFIQNQQEKLRTRLTHPFLLSQPWFEADALDSNPGSTPITKPLRAWGLC